MKKIKLLRAFVIALLVLILIRSIVNVLYFPIHQTKDVLLLFLNLSILFFIGLFYIERGLFHSIKKGYFNKDSGFKFKRGGLFILLSGCFGIIRGIFRIIVLDDAPDLHLVFFQGISQSIMAVLIGLVLITISDYIHKGNSIQQENELTI